MAEIKVVISNPKTGQSVQRVVEDGSALYGMKVGSKVDGAVIGLAGYQLEIRGGTDNAGFAMRRDIEGSLRKKILATEGIGVKRLKKKTKKGIAKFKGIKQRKTVSGSTVSSITSQLNMKILKKGKEDIFKKEETPKEAAPEKQPEKTKESGKGE